MTCTLEQSGNIDLGDCDGITTLEEAHLASALAPLMCYAAAVVCKSPPPPPKTELDVSRQNIPVYSFEAKAKLWAAESVENVGVDVLGRGGVVLWMGLENPHA